MEESVLKRFLRFQVRSRRVYLGIVLLTALMAALLIVVSIDASFLTWLLVALILAYFAGSLAYLYIRSAVLWKKK